MNRLSKVLDSKVTISSPRLGEDVAAEVDESRRLVVRRRWACIIGASTVGLIDGTLHPEVDVGASRKRNCAVRCHHAVRDPAENSVVDHDGAGKSRGRR